MGILDSSLYSMSFDAATLARIGSLINAQPTFITYYTMAMRACVAKVSADAMRNAPVLTGTLRRAIRGEVVSPYQGRVGVLAAVPYGRRREVGFDGMTDRLGRKFLSGDPLYRNSDKRNHMFFLLRGLSNNEPFIAATYRTSTQLAIRAVINSI